MFKCSQDKQINLFSSMSQQVSGRKRKLLDDPTSWHCLFFEQIVSQIDELPYSSLYSNTMGRPNSSVRMLIGMMILKEGQGWSDEQLFEECRFNLRVMRALGLANMNEDIPTESTYYEFRKALGEYNEEHEVDLIKETFLSIASKQVKEFNIGGKKIRMDSKLINSNIAKSTRLHLIVETVRKYVQDKELSTYEEKLESHIWDILKELQIKSTSNVTYPLNGQQKSDRLLEMGLIIQFLLEQNSDSTDINYQLLKRLYDEQYEEHSVDDISSQPENLNGEQNKAVDPQPKSAKQISSGSMQSVHDPEATFRSKGDGANKQNVSGFHANLTETCDPSDAVNLIVDTDVVQANICENEFLKTALENSEKVLQQAHESETNQIEEVITDGGYDSLENRSEMLKEQSAQWSIAKTKGGKRVYQIEKDDTEKIKVTYLPSQQKCEVTYSQGANKYVICHPNGSKRYMSIQQIENYIQRQNLEEQIDPASYNLRANAESTIHQVFHRLKKRNKMVYRGLQKCQWYVISRAFWTNLMRITAHKAINSSIIEIFANMLLRYCMVYSVLGIADLNRNHRFFSNI